jgi:hypothetical protein
LPPLLHVPFQFLVYYSVFGFFVFVCGVGVSLFKGLCWFIPEVPVGIPHVTYLFICWSSPVQEPSCFLSVTWCGEVLHGLGVKGFGVLILLGGFFLPRAVLVSQQNFSFTELTLSASAL